MERGYLNFLEIFNELTYLSTLYCLVHFNIYVPEAETRYTIGWIFIGIILFNILVNILVLLGVLFKGIWHSISKYINKKRRQQETTDKTIRIQPF